MFNAIINFSIRNKIIIGLFTWRWWAGVRGH